MSDLTLDEIRELRAKYAAAKTMRGYSAAKRCNVASSDYLEGWFVGYGKDESCSIEGTANHWRWLAMLILGLADPKESPYAEDKPTPEVVEQLLDHVERQAERIAMLAETLAKVDFAGPGKSLDEIDRSLKHRAERCPCLWGDLCSCANDCECRIRDLHQYVEGSGWENWGKIDAK